MTIGTILSLALIATMILNGIAGAVGEYRRNGWRKPSPFSHPHNGAF